MVSSTVDLRQFSDLQLRIEFNLTNMILNKFPENNQDFGIMSNNIGNLTGLNNGIIWMFNSFKVLIIYTDLLKYTIIKHNHDRIEKSRRN